MQLLALLALLLGTACYARQPHLIFIHADDLGWHSVGFREPALLTPALDDLRANGVELSSYYVSPRAHACPRKACARAFKALRTRATCPQSDTCARVQGLRFARKKHARSLPTA